MTTIIAGPVASLRNVTENLRDNVESYRMQEAKKGVQKKGGGVFMQKKIRLADNEPKGSWRIEIETPINKIKTVRRFKIK